MESKKPAEGKTDPTLFAATQFLQGECIWCTLEGKVENFKNIKNYNIPIDKMKINAKIITE
jgi:hypothetical protein